MTAQEKDAARSQSRREGSSSVRSVTNKPSRTSGRDALLGKVGKAINGLQKGPFAALDIGLEMREIDRATNAKLVIVRRESHEGNGLLNIFRSTVP